MSSPSYSIRLSSDSRLPENAFTSFDNELFSSGSMYTVIKGNTELVMDDPDLPNNSTMPYAAKQNKKKFLTLRRNNGKEVRLAGMGSMASKQFLLLDSPACKPSFNDRVRTKSEGTFLDPFLYTNCGVLNIVGMDGEVKTWKKVFAENNINDAVPTPRVSQADGGKAHKKYKGHSYVVRTGARGGKYILVKGEKVYV